MELYIPPPMMFIPRPPPRPVVPAVPVVPIPELPESIHAPEGTYTINKDMFPHTGSPAPPAYDPRAQQQMPSSFLAGAGGFIVSQPSVGMGMMAQPGQVGITAMSFGSTVVNGQSQPPWPVRMSWVNVWFPPKAGERGFGGLLGKGGKPEGAVDSTQPPPTMAGYEQDMDSDDDSMTGSELPPQTLLDLSFAVPPGQSAGSKRMPFTKSVSTTNVIPRPKNNLRSSNSTFVTRLQTMDNLVKIIAEKGKNGGEVVRWGIWNLGRTVAWGEEGGKIKEPLARVTFSQVPTCHAVSQLTAGPDRIDVIVGFASGDLVWVDFVLGKYTRLNKGGLLNNTAVISINFDPRQPHYFIAQFADSTILQFNVFADDPQITMPQANLPWMAHFENERKLLRAQADSLADENGTGNENGSIGRQSRENGGGSGSGSDRSRGNDYWEDTLIRWKNEDFALPLQDKDKKAKDVERSPWAAKNPIAAIKIGKGKNTAMAYSPDGRFLAVTGEDGNLRLVDVAEEALTDTFAGYFGALDCLAWSPDSRFVAVGGQDDLISIYSPRESRIVARCQGHSAFVTSISFDQTRQASRAYRFASVGEDGKLILWDFSAAALHRPRHHHLNTSSSHHKLAGSSLSLAGHSRSNLPGLVDGMRTSHFHPAPAKNDVAELQPVMSRMIEGTPLTGVQILSTAIITTSRAATVKFWQRPPKGSGTSDRHRGAVSMTGAGVGAGGQGREGRRERERTRESQREREAAMVTA